MELATMTPREIDTEIARIHEEAAPLINRANGLRREGNRYIKFGGRFVEQGERKLAQSREILEQATAKLSETEPFEAEYRRRPWKRYFLVTNTGGHVHRERNCSTCRPTTQYGWLVDLADCDEAAMVREYGETACTVCFPDAPTMDGWGERAEQAPADGKCANKNWDDVNGSSGRYYRRGRCKACGTMASITTAGNLRKHKIDA